jgi:Na+/H+-dicarboxylate symporter
VGIPAEGIALIIGVDRVLDMSRTTLNVAGDLVAASVIDQHTEHTEHEPDNTRTSAA